MYAALRAVANPDEDEAWESRIARKAFSEFLEKRGIDWKEGGPKNGERMDKIKPSGRAKTRRE